MEVNASPGLEGVETTTGVDVAGKMIAGSSAGDAGILFENRRLTAGCKTAMVCGAFCVSYGVVFHCKRSQALWIHWSFGLDTLRRWLDEIGISFLSAIPVRHCTCRICRISTVF